jgi:tetratricopeptide (TPR) repeat protein
MPALEAIALNLTATGLAAGGARSAQKVREVLRSRKFSEEIDELETEFNTLLQQHFIDELSNVEGVTEEEVRGNWDAIAAELDEIDVVFETEEAAIARITAAIATGLGCNLESNPELNESISGAVAGIYRKLIRSFEQRISGTELADRLSSRADIQLTSAVNEVAERLEQIERQQRRQRDARLREEGFVALSPLYFERQTPESPARCWRTGFELSEVYIGHAVEREAKREDGSRYRLAEDLFTRLQAETDCVVLGPPGSGKSTICKHVACRWYEVGEPVFYRSSGHNRPLSHWETLVDCIHETDGHTLVVVEDAVRDETLDIFRAIEACRQSADVTFLLDAREGEWHGSDTKLTEARLQEIKDRELTNVTVPRVDKRECERIVRHFESTTGASVADPPGELYEQVSTASGVGEVLQLAYHLSFYADGPDAAEPRGDGVTSLEKNVQTIVDQQCSDEEALSLPLGILVNLLNATDIGAHPELLHGLAESETKHRKIDMLLQRYEGTLVFTNQNQPVADQIEPFRTNHELWSTLYLQGVIELLGEREATRRFEACLKQLFNLIDNADRRTDINRWFRREMPFFRELESSPTETADGFVERVFDLGRRHPVLATLYGTTKFTVVEAPEACSPDIPIRMALWRGIMYFHGGEYESAEAEFEATRDLLHDDNRVATRLRREIEAWCLNYLGAIDRTQGDLEQARERHWRSHEQFQEIGNTLGEAFSLYNIGKMYRVKSDLDAAERYLTDALETFKQTGERRYVSNTLNRLC